MIARVRALALGLALVPSIAGPLLTMSRPALAQEDPAITAEARKRFLEGVKLFDQKKFELARAAFVQAYALKKHPDVLLNLAEAELQSGHPFDAANHFRDFLRDPATAQHPRRGDAQKGLDDARSHIGRIQISVDAPDAEVYLDGKKIGSSPMAEAVDVTPGPHVTEARKDGKSAKEGVIATEGKITMSSLSLGGGGGAAVVPPVDSTPKTDDTKPPKDDTTTPKDEPKTDVPKPEDKSTGGGYESFLDWQKRSAIAWAGDGLFVVGLGLGVVMSIEASKAQSTVDDLTTKLKTAAAQDPYLTTPEAKAAPCAPGTPQTLNHYAGVCNDLQTSLNQKSSDSNVATVGFVLAGVGAVGVVGGYFLTRKTADEAAASAKQDESQTKLAVTPLLSPQLLGFGARGTF
jgi:hypothetical protein